MGSPPWLLDDGLQLGGSQHVPHSCIAAQIGLAGPTDALGPPGPAGTCQGCVGRARNAALSASQRSAPWVVDHLDVWKCRWARERRSRAHLSFSA